jgi:Zn-dependent protease with chaperone function
LSAGSEPAPPRAFDFRAAQASARRRSVLFVVLFVCVVALVAGTAAFFAMLWTQMLAWEPFLWWVLVLMTPILLAAAYRAWQLGGDGASVARALGAVEVPAATRNLYQRRYRNVVEETAIAAGLPVPRVFLIKREQGINAFAAGRQPDCAAIAVTHGALAKLSRDELAGVVAHEMGHIRNADIRLNTNIAAMVYGLAFLFVVGLELMGGRGITPRRMHLPGLFLVAVGAIGWFGARLIQAGISQRREFLADATAIEFTRDPKGLAGALRKIAATSAGSRVANPHCQEARHMFFGSLGAADGGGFDTHPPLVERIRRLEPSYDPATDPMSSAGDDSILRDTRAGLVAEFSQASSTAAGASVPRVRRR